VAIAVIELTKVVESSKVFATSTEAREATAADAEGSAPCAMFVNDDTTACVESVRPTSIFKYKLRLLTTVAAAEVLCPHKRHDVVLLLVEVGK
jgi:hypothetical protein